MPSSEIVVPPYRFWVTTSGGGSPVVLIHGLGGSSDWWRYNVPALAESHTVAAVDLVGFGRNRFFLRRSRLPLSFPEVAALLARWIERAFGEPVHLVGNSMGGHTAIHLAASRPELVRSLTLVNSTGIPFALDPRAHVENIVMPRGMMSFARVLARDLFRAGPTSVAIAFARLLRDDARPLMRQLRMPVLLLSGEDDPLVPLTYAEQMRGLIPHARLVRVPRAGHIPMWENPEAFNAELMSFLREVDASHGDTKARGAFSWALAGWTAGIAHREAGHARDVILIHGLGMSSAYFEPFARALFARGVDPIAPDLPGFGESLNSPARTPREDAALLARWADTLRIREAVWIGHSSGCHAVAHLNRDRPDLVREAIAIGPLWSSTRHPHFRFAFRLIEDIFREPLALAAYVIRAYWRTGFARWLATWRRVAKDLRESVPTDVRLVAGDRDPIPDRASLRMESVPGAHACHFSHPDGCADLLRASVVNADGDRNS